MNNKRVCFIEIEALDNGKKQLKRLDGLAIKGTVSRKAGSVQAEASVSIANLSKSDIEYISTYTSPYFKPRTQKKLNIYAGYSQTGWGRIFTGDIIEAIPQDMPDIWMNIKAKSLYYQQRTPITYGVGNTTIKELALSISNQLGLHCEWKANNNSRIESFNHIGSVGELVKEFNKLENVVMYEDNGILKVIDREPKFDIKNKIKLISLESGLIGDVEPDQYGIKLKTLLDPSDYCGRWIQTKSKKLPGTNGIYQIYTLDFDFSSREQQFYSKIYARTSGNFYKK